MRVGWKNGRIEKGRGRGRAVRVVFMDGNRLGLEGRVLHQVR